MNATTHHPGLKRLIMGMVSVLVIAIILAEAYAWFERRISGENAQWLGAFVVNAALAVCALVLWWRRGSWVMIPHAGWRWFAALSPRTGTLVSFLPAAAVLIGAMMLGFSSQVFGTPEKSFSFTNSQWFFIFGVPVVEEWGFRAGAGSYFRRLCGQTWGAYFSAMLFSMVHSLPTWSRVMELKIGLLPGPLLLGIVCELLLAATGRILPAIALHMACNGTVIIFTVTDGRWLKWLDFLYIGR